MGRRRKARNVPRPRTPRNGVNWPLERRDTGAKLNRNLNSAALSSTRAGTLYGRQAGRQATLD